MEGREGKTKLFKDIDPIDKNQISLEN